MTHAAPLLSAPLLPPPCSKLLPQQQPAAPELSPLAPCRQQGVCCMFNTR